MVSEGMGRGLGAAVPSGCTLVASGVVIVMTVIAMRMMVVVVVVIHMVVGMICESILRAYKNATKYV